jgi:CTP synthase
VKELQSVGIRPDMVVCRCDRPIPESQRNKISLFCNIRPEAVVPALDVDTIYQVPIDYHQEGFDNQVLRHFGLDATVTPNLDVWRQIVSRIRFPDGEVKIAVVGKYTDLPDAYKSRRTVASPIMPGSISTGSHPKRSRKRIPSNN